MSGPRFRLPVPSPAAPSLDAFVLFPPACLPVVSPEYAAWQKELYARALAEAQAVVRPSLLERDLLGVWN
jgi:hypothetical protein